MSLRLVVGFLGGLSCLALTSLSQAQCSKDTDCKGERICEQGSCVAPPTAATTPTASAAGTGQAQAAATSAALAPSAATPTAAPYSTEVVDTRKKRRRHSTGMMAGGIVMVSFVPVALLAAWVADIRQGQCERGSGFLNSDPATRGVNCERFDKTIYGGLISAAVLLGAGVPMIIIGGKREPLGTAKLSPWATPQAAGVSLRLDL